MIFVATPLMGAFVVHPEKRRDERGFFARSWCRREFQQRGLSTELSQCSISYNQRRGTLRGLHYQIAPNAEAKLVRCTRGALFDAIVDLRPHSPTHRDWFGVTLTADNYAMLYVPEGFAHGFLTLQDDTEVFYQMSQAYHAESARGVRWNDPVFAIKWPKTAISVISDKDSSYPDYGS